MRTVSSGKIAIGLLVALIVVAGSASAENASMLLGKWMLSGEKQDTFEPGSQCVKTELGFTPNLEAWIEGGKQVNERVLGYAMSGTDVHVTTMGGEDAYTIVDHDHIQYNQMRVACHYTRLK